MQIVANDEPSLEVVHRYLVDQQEVSSCRVDRLANWL